jgi:hypothetical protein
MAASESLSSDQQYVSESLQPDVDQASHNDIPNVGESAPVFDRNIAGHENVSSVDHARKYDGGCPYLDGLEKMMGSAAVQFLAEASFRDAERKAQKAQAERDPQRDTTDSPTAEKPTRIEKPNAESAQTGVQTETKPSAEPETMPNSAAQEQPTATILSAEERQNSVQEPKTVEQQSPVSQSVTEVLPQAESVTHSITPDSHGFEDEKHYDQVPLPSEKNTPATEEFEAPEIPQQHHTFEAVGTDSQVTLQPRYAFSEANETMAPQYDMPNDPAVLSRQERIDNDPMQFALTEATEAAEAEGFRTSFETAPSPYGEFTTDYAAEDEVARLKNESETSDEEMDAVVGRWLAEFEASGTIDATLELPEPIVASEMATEQEPIAEVDSTIAMASETTEVPSPLPTTIAEAGVVGADTEDIPEAGTVADIVTTPLAIAPAVELVAIELSNRMEALDPEETAEVHHLLVEVMDEIQAIQEITPELSEAAMRLASEVDAGTDTELSKLDTAETTAEATETIQTEDIAVASEIQIDTTALEAVMHRLCKSAGLEYSQEEIHSLVQQLIKETSVADKGSLSKLQGSADWGTRESLQWFTSQIRNMSRQTNSLHRLVNRVGEYALLSLREMQTA